MSWEYLLSEDDFRLYRNNIYLLEAQVIQHFPDYNKAPEILSAIRNVPRHFFVHQSYRYLAYTDHAYPTCSGLTTSAPSVIAEMIYLTGIKRGEKLLEIGTGTGYEAAILSEMGVTVFTIEIDQQVALEANKVLIQLGYKIDKRISNEQKRKENLSEFYKVNKLFSHRGMIELYMGNGCKGLPIKAPFHGIIVAASIYQSKNIEHLIAQLIDEGGRLVVPIGNRQEQIMHIFEKRKHRVHTSILEDISFNFVRLILE
ncbi:MAG: protein-L-isoaspartate O-methyltransferase [Spirochaetota bacterium]|nr:MAG: protein-L-isoaspartate O-methyltransferase [Spirochaetota bacterium]